MSREAVMKDLRFAGSVLRYHTWPTLQRQTNADHTWHVMRIYYQIFGPLSQAVSSYLLFHDAGELRAGDAPFPVKALNPVFKAEHDRLGDLQLHDMGINFCVITDQDRVRCKICDLIEMCDFGLVEVAMGNTLAQCIADDTRASAVRMANTLPGDEPTKVSSYLSLLLRRFS